MSEEVNSNKIRWIIRPMRHVDIERCLQIWAQVELTEARQTVTSTLSADPGGFYVAEHEETGEYRLNGQSKRYHYILTISTSIIFHSK